MKEHSYGIIPLRKQSGQLEVFMIHQAAGHWGFPKGHLEAGEDPKKGALRELKEETNFSVTRFCTDKTLTENYTFKREGAQVEKEVTYFFAWVEGEFKPQEEEVQAGQWLLPEELEKHSSFPEGKQICQKIIEVTHAISIAQGGQ